MAEERAELQPVMDGGGLIGSIKRATFGLGQMLEATQRWADGTTAQMERVTESAREAKSEVAALRGASQAVSSAEKSDSTRSETTTPGGRVATSTSAALGAVTNAVIQSEGRRT